MDSDTGRDPLIFKGARAQERSTHQLTKLYRRNRMVRKALVGESKSARNSTAQDKGSKAPHLHGVKGRPAQRRDPFVQPGEPWVLGMAADEAGVDLLNDDGDLVEAEAVVE